MERCALTMAWVKCPRVMSGVKVVFGRIRVMRRSIVMMAEGRRCDGAAAAGQREQRLGRQGRCREG